jgi:phage-related holin
MVAKDGGIKTHNNGGINIYIYILYYIYIMDYIGHIVEAGSQQSIKTQGDCLPALL